MEHDVGALADLEDGAMRGIEVDGNAVLLIRSGETVTALSGTCPHAGGPLAGGVLHRGRIICPWHKATFCARTGAIREPPAVDPLPRYAVTIRDGRVLVGEPEPEQLPAKSGGDGRCFVIIGGGAAGGTAAIALRQSGFAGRIVLIDRENRVPYDRTVLSKYFLSGQQGGEKSPLQNQAFFRAHDIERWTDAATRIDPAAKTVHLRKGGTLPYDRLLLASGADPARPDWPGTDLPHVFLLRNRRDADAILAQAERVEHAVVIGASFIGMEVAASLRERGLDVTVVAKESTPFEKQLGPEIGSVFTRLHEGRGVGFRFRANTRRITAAGVELDSGEILPAGIVVIGLGVRPAAIEIDGIAPAKDGGTIADATLQVTDGVHAAGDLAHFPLRGDGPLIRVEHWRVAEQQGRLAALNMMSSSPARYEAVPVFWTIQYLQRLDYVGHAKEWDDLIIHGDLSKPEFLAYYVKAGNVAAVAGFGRDQEMAAVIALFEEQRDWTPDALGASPAAVLRSRNRIGQQRE